MVHPEDAVGPPAVDLVRVRITVVKLRVTSDPTGSAPSAVRERDVVPLKAASDVRMVPGPIRTVRVIHARVPSRWFVPDVEPRPASPCHLYVAGIGRVSCRRHSRQSRWCSRWDCRWSRWCRRRTPGWWQRWGRSRISCGGHGRNCSWFQGRHRGWIQGRFRGWHRGRDRRFHSLEVPVQASIQTRSCAAE